MKFIGSLKFEKVPGLLDSEEKITEARKILEESTRESFEKLRIAGARSWLHAQKIILD